MPSTTSTLARSNRDFPTAALFLRCLLMALPVLFLGCAPSDPGTPPVPTQAAGGQPSLAEHDIAPWDGAAFGIWIPAEQYGGKPDSWIYLRIWSAPEDSQRKFVFPDNSMKVGHVVCFLDLESPRTLDWTNQPRQELEGWVEFISASAGQPIVGEFDFVSKFDFASEGSTSLKGRFEAAWIDERRVEEAAQGDDGASR